MSAGRRGKALWVLTCEHGGYALPREYGTLGLARADLRDHIGWDIGAAEVTKEVARRLRLPSVVSRYSRLLVDLNRAGEEASLIPEESDGRTVPGNRNLSEEERRRRLDRFHAPYHERVDRVIAKALSDARGRPVRLLSVHSFTPILNGRARPFDIGVLFDDHEHLARRLGRALRAVAFTIRYNQPYSGREGLIYSARRHGRAHRIPYLELEINNALLRTPAAIRHLARPLSHALGDVV